MKFSVDASSVLIDQVSLKYFAQKTSFVANLDRDIAARIGGTVVDNDEHVAGFVKTLSWVGIETISELESALNMHSKEIVDWAADYLRVGEPGGKTLSSGICLFYLCYCMVAERGSVEEMEAYLRDNNIHGRGTLVGLAKKLIKKYGELKS
jgi:hypothetical protein